VHSPDPSELRSVVEYLSRQWPNRNSNLPTHREAAGWIHDRFLSLGLTAEFLEYPLTPGPRVFSESAVLVVATLPGTDLAEERVMVSAHLDTINWTDRVNDPYGINAPSPGANDDASGIACVLECARVLRDLEPRRTIQFVAFSGEEQGLLGAKWLAQRAAAEGWKIAAVLNNDMIANAVDDHGRSETQRVRVLSPEGRSRDLARWMHWEMPEHVKLIFRHDRFGRGGDHTPFNQAGFTAVRMTEVCENYGRQHTPQDTTDFMDFDYLARVTDLNAQTLARVAVAAPDVFNVKVDPTQGYGARITWEGDGARWLYWRDTTSPVWEGRIPIEGNEAVVSEPHKDDAIFAVSTGGIPVEAQ